MLPYQLEVFVNGHPTKLIVGFDDVGGGRFAAMATDLSDLGLAVPDSLRGSALIPLEQFGTYRYDEAKQQLYLDVPAGRLKAQSLDARGSEIRKEPAVSGRGMVLNYAMFGNVTEAIGRSGDQAIAKSMTTSFDGRVFAPEGLLQFGAIAGTALSSGQDVVRLDTTWSKFDERTMTTWRVGDAIGGALTWTRPIRFGGVQYQRNFALRPDLVTLPLPSITGSAAVPSTVDVFVDGVRTYSQDINAGPFTISNVPVFGNGGTARIVVRDASGRVTEFSSPFFTAPKLLKADLFDWSYEAGLPRQSFGALSFDYAPDPIVAATARYGLTDTLTLEGHSEAGMGVVNSGAGAVFPLGPFVMSTAVMGSVRKEDFGGRAYVSANALWRGVTVTATSSYDVGSYFDLATASTIATAKFDVDVKSYLSRFSNLINISAPLSFLDPLFDKPGGTTAAFTLIGSQSAAGVEQRLAMGSLTQRLSDDLSLYATGSYDLMSRDVTAYIGASLTFDKSQSGGLSMQRSADAKIGVTADYAQQNDGRSGSFGWRTSVTRGDGERTAGAVSYTADAQRIEATAISTPNSRYASATVQGGIAMLGDKVYMTRTVIDSFAVVDVGYAGVEVLNQNNVVGTTDEQGRLFVPNLISQQYNKIAIDPVRLPPDVQPSRVEAKVVPMRGAGLAVDMRVKPAPSSALVEFVTTAGEPVTTGTTGRVLATGEEFVVGFDGQAFLTALAAKNDVELALPEAPCRAAFAFAAKPGEQVFVPKVVCQ